MKKPHCKAILALQCGFLNGPSGESRTHGLLNPIQARYQTALHPDICRFLRQVILYDAIEHLSSSFSPDSLRSFALPHAAEPGGTARSNIESVHCALQCR